MECCVCHKPILRGQRFKSPTLTTLKFCSEARYLQRTQSTKWLDKLKAYLDELYDGQVNWPFMSKQIKSAMEEYEVDYKDLYHMIKYAVVYADVIVDPQYGLQQFIKYLQPSQEFAEEIRKNQALAENMEDDEVEVVKASRGSGKRWMKGDWEF